MGQENLFYILLVTGRSIMSFDYFYFALDKLPRMALFAPKWSGKRDVCVKGYSCGATCISRALKCRKQLSGQAATYADWLEMQFSSGASLSEFHSAEAKARGISPPASTEGYGGLRLDRSLEGVKDGEYIVVEKATWVAGYLASVNVEGDWERPHIAPDSFLRQSKAELNSKRTKGLLYYRTDELQDGVYKAQSVWRSRGEPTKTYIKIENKRIVAFSQDPLDAREWLPQESIDKLKAASKAKSEINAALPELSGSEKQIAWANDIRAKAMAKAKTQEEKDAIAKQTESRYWIDNRSRYY